VNSRAPAPLRQCKSSERTLERLILHFGQSRLRTTIAQIAHVATEPPGAGKYPPTRKAPRWGLVGERATERRLLGRRVVRELAGSAVNFRGGALSTKQRVSSGAVAVASEIHGEKWQGLGLEQHNWAFKKEDPFRKWEV